MPSGPQLESRGRLIRSLGSLREMLPGSFVERKRACGRPNCHCANGKNLHSQYQISVLVEGKPKSFHVSVKLVEQVRQKVEMHQRFDATAATICALAAASISVAASAKGGIGSQGSRFPAIAMFGPQFATDGNTNGYRWPNTRTLPLPLSCATLLEQTKRHRR